MNDWSQQRVLVTGGAGLIGSALVWALNQRGCENIVVCDLLQTSEKWRNLTPLRFADYLEADDLRPRLESGRLGHFHHVLHLGACSATTERDSSYLMRNNYEFTKDLALWSLAKGARFVYASSSAVYGDSPDLPKFEDKIGKQLSPYAATKKINETYAEAFAITYQTQSIGLRYFNVFGPRQDPEGAYAAVIPKWIAALLRREPVLVNGDGETSRDFCYIDNVVQANLLGAAAQNAEAINQVYNVAVGERTTLNDLFRALQSKLCRRDPNLPQQPPIYQDFRAGDVRHSLADISKAQRLLGYSPNYLLDDGLDCALDWYCANAVASAR